MDQDRETDQSFCKRFSIDETFTEAKLSLLRIRPANPLGYLTFCFHELSIAQCTSSIREFFDSCEIKFAMNTYSLCGTSAESAASQSVLTQPVYSGTVASQEYASIYPGEVDSQLHVMNSVHQPDLSRFNRDRRKSFRGDSLRPTEEPAERIVFPKSQETKEKIRSATKGTLLFKNLKEDVKDEIIDAMFEVRVPAGVSIINKGDDGDFFYVVEHGQFDIVIDGQKVLTSGEGTTFGELALFYNRPRAATVTATEDSAIWAVDRLTFRRLIMNNAYQRSLVCKGFLRTVPILEPLGEEEISRIADALVECDFVCGEEIIKQGDVGDRFFIIIDGEADIFIERDGQEHHMGRLERGSYFGELAILEDSPRAASVIAATERVRCMSLDRDGFVRMLGPINEALRGHIPEYSRVQ